MTRLDRALDLADRAVVALELIAQALERIADTLEGEPSPKPRRKRAPKVRQPPASPSSAPPTVDDVPDHHVLYIGQAVDVGARLLGHPRLTDLYQRWHLVPDDLRARLVPVVSIYEGKPNNVEGALRRVCGMPPWNAKPIRPSDSPLVQVGEVSGADVWRIAYRRDLGWRGGYAIGLRGAREDTRKALGAMTSSLVRSLL